MKCAIQTFSSYWISVESHFLQKNVQRMIRWWSAEAHVRTIQSLWHRSLTFSISERVKWSMEPFLTLTRQTRRPVAADRISFWKQHRFLVSMYLPSIKLPIKKMAPSNPSSPNMKMYRKRLKNSSLSIWIKITINWKLRSFLISRQHRIVLLWKSSVAVSADAVSARLAWSTVLQENVISRH